MMIYLWFSKSFVNVTCSVFPKVPRCWPWFLSVVIWSIVTPAWYVVGTTTINTYGVAHTCFCRYTAHFCIMRPCSASCAENILMAIFPKMVHTSTGSASYLWPTCASLGAGDRLGLTPSMWTLHFSSFRWFPHGFHLFSISSKGVNYFYFTSIVGRVQSIHVSFYHWFRCWCWLCCSLLWSCISNRWYGAVIIFIKTIPVISSELWDPKFELESCPWSASWALAGHLHTYSCLLACTPSFLTHLNQ